MADNQLANPAPLGLMGFGMTTVLLNIHNAGFYPLADMVLAMGIFYGGMAQVFAGLAEFKKGNTFGMTAFTSYGLFWLSLVFIIMYPGFPTERGFMGWYLFMWGLFTFFMFIGTLKHNKALQVIFSSLTVLFFLLAIEHWFKMPKIFSQITGWEGIFCGFSAIYAAMAQVINEAFGKTVMPLGE